MDQNLKNFKLKKSIIHTEYKGIYTIYVCIYIEYIYRKSRQSNFLFNSYNSFSLKNFLKHLM